MEDIKDIKPEHIKLISKMNITWNSCEFGAPEVNPKRPYGNGDVYKDMAGILGMELFECAGGEKHFTKEQIDSLESLHRETESVLQIICKNLPNIINLNK